MTVLWFSPDPDFGALLAFLLRHHGIRVVMLEPETMSEPDAESEAATLLLVDLATTALPDAAHARLARWGDAYPSLVLTRPAAIAQAQALLPEARGFIATPLQPLALMRRIHQVLEDGGAEVSGYAARRHPVG